MDEVRSTYKWILLETLRLCLVQEFLQLFLLPKRSEFLITKLDPELSLGRCVEVRREGRAEGLLRL